jgi:outer membrane protein, multidrug efflux system
MTSRLLAPGALVLALLAAGCATLEPPLPAAQPGVAPAWPAAGTPTGTGTDAAQVADIGWRDFVVDDRLETLVARSLANNRDLRVAVLNVERARSLYRIQGSERFPSVSGGLEMTRTGGDDAPTMSSYGANVGVAGFELDLFGRVRSLGEAALREYFASEEARRAAQLSLVAEVAGAYLALAADRELVRVARAALENREQWFGLTQKRFDLGAVSRLDLAQARTLVESARADAARYEGQVARGANALALLVGEPVEDSLLPTRFDESVQGLDPVPAGLPSEVLLRRPDVVQAEQRLRAANASIGAARAAFFPSIRLTGAVGTASAELSGLFSGGSFAWSFLPRIDVPIFQGGRLAANLGVSTADRDIALARYEKSIQAGFREVADGLALARALASQRAALEAQVAAASQAQDLSRARYDAGADSFLVLLDTQRTLYAAQQALVATRLAEQSNRVTLYKVLGGGWKERT